MKMAGVYNVPLGGRGGISNTTKIKSPVHYLIL